MTNKVQRYLQHIAIRFTLANLHIVRELEDSIAINQIKGGAVILAGAGMCTGGRIQHHLKHHFVGT